MKIRELWRLRKNASSLETEFEANIRMRKLCKIYCPLIAKTLSGQASLTARQLIPFSQIHPGKVWLELDSIESATLCVCLQRARRQAISFYFLSLSLLSRSFSVSLHLTHCLNDKRQSFSRFYLNNIVASKSST